MENKEINQNKERRKKRRKESK